MSALTAVLIAIAAMTLLGMPLTLALERAARGGYLIGMSFLYGGGIVFAVLLGFGVMGVQWTLTRVAIVLLLVACGWLLVLSRQSTSNEQQGTSNLLDLVPAWLIAGYALYATITRPWEWDFWAIWGMKARAFFELGTIDWALMQDRWNNFVHPDYPLLLPLHFDFAALIGGAWDDRWLGVLFVAYGVALLLVARELAARETTPLIAAVATLAMTQWAFTNYIGLGEGPLIAYGTAGILQLRRGATTHAALLLGLAAHCKNEGLALLAAVAIALVLTRAWRTLIRIWPACAIAAVWLILRAVFALPSDLASGTPWERLTARLPHAGTIAGWLVEVLPDPWTWMAVLAALLVAGNLRSERLVLIISAVQLAFMVGAYFVTPHDVEWHIYTSWQRLSRQVLPALVWLAVVMLAKLPLHAEARSER